mgnify:CR=1 FL=1
MRSKPSWNDVILTINPSVQSSKLKRIEDPKLQDELLRFDEHQLVKKYKFGILYCKSNQKKEEEMFGNGNFNIKIKNKSKIKKLINFQIK